MLSEEYLENYLPNKIKYNKHIGYSMHKPSEIYYIKEECDLRLCIIEDDNYIEIFYRNKLSEYLPFFKKIIFEGDKNTSIKEIISNFNLIFGDIKDFVEIYQKRNIILLDI